MYTGYKHQISNAQLEKSRAQLENTQARVMAAKMFGLWIDASEQSIHAAMNARLRLAFAMIDAEDNPGDNGVEPVAFTPPMPYVLGDDEVLPY